MDEEKDFEMKIIPKVSDFWKDVLVKYREDQYPTRAWIWAWAAAVERIARDRRTTAEDCIHYLATHKREYLKFLYENRLPFNMHDKYYGFSFYKGENKQRESEETKWKQFLAPDTGRKTWDE